MYNINEALENKKLFSRIADQFFEAIDIDNSGRISEDELHTILTNLADNFNFERPTVDETQKILEIVDIDRSGFVDRIEFSRLLKKVLKAVRDDEEKNKKNKYDEDDEDNINNF